MADGVVPEYTRFVAEERRARRLAALRATMPEGEVFETVFVEAGKQPNSRASPRGVAPASTGRATHRDRVGRRRESSSR